MVKYLILIPLECALIALGAFIVYALRDMDTKEEKALFSLFLVLDFIVMVCTAIGIIGY